MKAENEIADAYEAAITSGTADSVAVEHALARWRSYFPNASDYETRTGVAQIIAEQRMRMRDQGSWPGGSLPEDRGVADKEN
jgi:hypothetical protein